MKSVRFKQANPSVLRRLRAADFESLAIPDQDDDVTWDALNDHTVLLKNKVAEKLVSELEDEFEILEDDNADSPES